MKAEIYILVPIIPKKLLNLINRDERQAYDM